MLKKRKKKKNQAHPRDLKEKKKPGEKFKRYILYVSKYFRLYTMRIVTTQYYLTV